VTRVARVRSSAAEAIQAFRLDAARWIRPEDIATPDEVTTTRVLQLLVHHRSLRALGWFRAASLAKAVRIPYVPGAIQRRVHRVFGLELVPGTPIGGGLYIAHPSGCTIVAEEIGENVSIMAAITVGRLRAESWPRIGDGVFIGAGARVLGPIRVGADAVIGANAVVVSDVAPAAVVAGVPARQIQNPLTRVEATSS
jgi:serine O-acetyltransferase